MKKVGAVVVGVLVTMVLLPQVALAGTSVHVGISTPCIYFEASSVRPSPHHVWVDGRYAWHGPRRAWVPGHWGYAPVARTVYVPARHTQSRDCDYRDNQRGHDSGQDRRGNQHDRFDRGEGNNGLTDRHGSDRD